MSWGTSYSDFAYNDFSNFNTSTPLSQNQDFDQKPFNDPFNVQSGQNSLFSLETKTEEASEPAPKRQKSLFEVGQYGTSAKSGKSASKSVFEEMGFLQSDGTVSFEPVARSLSKQKTGGGFGEPVSLLAGMAGGGGWDYNYSANQYSGASDVADLEGVNPRAIPALRKAATYQPLSPKDYFDLQVSVKEGAMRGTPLEPLILAYRTYLQASDVERLLDDPIIVDILNNVQEGKPPSDALMKGFKLPAGSQKPVLSETPKFGMTGPPPGMGGGAVPIGYYGGGPMMNRPAGPIVPPHRLHLFDPRPMVGSGEVPYASLRIILRGIRDNELDGEDIRTLRSTLFNRMVVELKNPFPLVALLSGKLPTDVFKGVINENIFNRLTASARQFGITPREFRLVMEGMLCPRAIRFPDIPDLDVNPKLAEEQVKQDPTQYSLDEIPGVIKGQEEGTHTITQQTKRWIEAVVYSTCKKGQEHGPFLDKMAEYFGEAQVKKLRESQRMQRTVENAKKNKEMSPEPESDDNAEGKQEGSVSNGEKSEETVGKKEGKIEGTVEEKEDKIEAKVNDVEEGENAGEKVAN